MDQTKAKLRNELVYAAKYLRHRDYLTLSYLIGLEKEDRQAVNQLLREISLDEHKDGKPILWPLVVEDETGLPNSGYYEVLKEIGNENSGKDRKAAYEEGLEEVFSYWARRKKTGKSGTRKKF